MGDGWRVALGPVTARIGSAGVGAASEGSTRTPAGTFRLTEAFGRAGNPRTALPYRRVDGDDWWVSDGNSRRYNRYAECAPGTCDFDERAGENLYARGRVYDQAVVIDYNRQGRRGAGSAFFLHIGNGAPTGGCVAIDQYALEKQAVPGFDALSPRTVEMAANVLLFVPVAFFFAAAAPRVPGALVWLLCTAASVGVETAQLALPGRQPTVRHVVLDSAGAAIGVLLHTFLSRRRSRSPG